MRHPSDILITYTRPRGPGRTTRPSRSEAKVGGVDRVAGRRPHRPHPTGAEVAVEERPVQPGQARARTTTPPVTEQPPRRGSRSDRGDERPLARCRADRGPEPPVPRRGPNQAAVSASVAVGDEFVDLPMWFWPTSPIHRSPLAGSVDAPRVAQPGRPDQRLTGRHPADERVVEDAVGSRRIDAQDLPSSVLRLAVALGVVRRASVPKPAYSIPSGPNRSDPRCGSGTAARSRRAGDGCRGRLRSRPHRSTRTRRSGSHRGRLGVGDVEVLAVGATVMPSSPLHVGAADRGGSGRSPARR